VDKRDFIKAKYSSS